MWSGTAPMSPALLCRTVMCRWSSLALVASPSAQALHSASSRSSMRVVVDCRTCSPCSCTRSSSFCRPKSSTCVSRPDTFCFWRSRKRRCARRFFSCIRAMRSACDADVSAAPLRPEGRGRSESEPSDSTGERFRDREGAAGAAAGAETGGREGREGRAGSGGSPRPAPGIGQPGIGPGIGPGAEGGSPNDIMMLCERDGGREAGA